MGGSSSSQCKLVLYEGGSHTGTARHYSGNTDLRAKGEQDRDYSAHLTGDCKNTSYLVFPHPWDHKGENGGLGYLIGESDNPRDMDRPGVTTNPIGSRYWKHRGNADNIVRIDIPSENINEGRMREDIKVMGKSNSGGAGDTHLDLRRANNGNPNRSDQWLTGIYNDQNSIKKGQPCPGGDAYWKKAMDSEISCVYDVKTGDKLGRIRTLHSEIKNSFSGDPRKAMFDKITKKYCDRAERLNDKVTSGSGDDSTCRGFSNAKVLAKQYCEQGDKIKTDTMLCTKETDSLGPTLYDELAAKYCDANKDDPFCGCYNVLNNKCLTEENKDLPGCKITVPIRRTLTDLPRKYSAALDGTDKCWGNVCASKGDDNFVPVGTIDAICSKSMTICNVDLSVGNIQGSEINIEQSCGEQEGEPSEPSDGSTDGTPAPMKSPSVPSTSTPAPSVPSTSTPAPSVPSTPSVVAGTASTEELQFYEKPSVQIGTVVSSLVSASSCALLIMLTM